MNTDTDTEKMTTTLDRGNSENKSFFIVFDKTQCENVK